MVGEPGERAGAAQAGHGWGSGHERHPLLERVAIFGGLVVVGAVVLGGLLAWLLRESFLAGGRHLSEHPDETILWLAVAVGASIALLGFVATHLIRLLGALDHSEARYRATFDHAAVGIARVGLDGRWLEPNQHYCDILGYTCPELLLRTFQDVTHPDDLEADLALAQKLFAGEIPTYSMEKRYVRKDGGVVWVQISCSMVRRPSGEPLHYVAVAVDISERRAAQEALRRAEWQSTRLYQEAQDAIRLRDGFLSIASHELKTPLTPLALQVGSIQRSLRRDPASIGPDKLSARMEIIARQVTRLTRLVTELLDISRLTAGRVGLHIEEVDVAAVARDVAVRLGYELGRAGCKLEVRAEGPIAGCWDRVRLGQIVMNLVSNAAKYGAGKPIDLVVEGDVGTARIIVRDHGIGIAPEHQRRIFDRFERAVSDQHYGGFGLGLWIVKQLVDALGGTIRVESELGRGATFVVELPRRLEERSEAA
jgi:PAS domain S-box-containing protein